MLKLNSGGIVPIIPIFPFPPPPIGFIPPVSEPAPVIIYCPKLIQTATSHQEHQIRTKRRAQTRRTTNAPIAVANMAGVNNPQIKAVRAKKHALKANTPPKCGDQQCEGDQEIQCTVGPQKGCECKPAFQEGQDRVSYLSILIETVDYEELTLVFQATVHGQYLSR